MPTYDYHCPKCGTFEVYQSIKDPTLTVCPTCKSKKLSKLLSTGSGVIFSGSGFWETDYNRSADYTTKKKSESAAPVAKTEAKSETKSEAKSEAKSETKGEAKGGKPAAAAAAPSPAKPAKPAPAK